MTGEMCKAARRWYCYRRGDGNEGNFPRYLICLTDDEAWRALPAMLANDYHVGRVRRHIIRNVGDVQGEPEHGLSVMVYEGPDGEQAFGAAWLTAELEPCPDPEAWSGLIQWDTLRAVLDKAAWRQYRAACSNG